MPGSFQNLMKSTRILALCMFAFSGAAAFAQIGLPAYVPMKVDQTEEAVFPRKLVAVGIKSGAVSLAIAVDDTGKLTDYLVTAYSHPAFAESAVTALKKWKFEPAQIHGVSRNSKSDITFRFEVEGVVVVTLTPISYAELVHFKIFPGSEAYSACTLAQLDRIPTPTKIVNPVYPDQLARSSSGGRIHVEFYIDENGRTRMPSVSRETDEANEALSAAAITAVSQWQFDPPTMKGKPVLVLAQQDFNFKPAAK
jgi:TonB family protein